MTPSSTCLWPFFGENGNKISQTQVPWLSLITITRDFEESQTTSSTHPSRLVNKEGVKICHEIQAFWPCSTISASEDALATTFGREQYSRRHG